MYLAVRGCHHMQESGFMALKDRGNRRTAFLTLVLFMRQDSEEKGARIDCVYRWLVQKSHLFIGCFLESIWSSSPWSQRRELREFQ